MHVMLTSRERLAADLAITGLTDHLMWTLLDGLEPHRRMILSLRYGLRGYPPKTPADIARCLDLDEDVVERTLRTSLLVLQRRADAAAPQGRR